VTEAARDPLSETGLWRSVEDLAGDARSRRHPDHHLFEAGLTALAPHDRRQFLQVMASSVALAGLTACTPRDRTQIVPYARASDPGQDAGRPLFFATAMLHAGYASPVVVESHMGRPIKVEGNPEHPESLGATDIFAQAGLLQLYDPDRSRTVRRRGRIATWESFTRTWSEELARQRDRRGAGLRILTGRCCSPTFDAALQRLARALPELRWHRHEPIDDDAARLAARRVLGDDLVLRPRLQEATRVLALDADFLFAAESRVPNALAFAAARSAWQRRDGRMLRLYAVESTPTLTGANADHRLPRRAADLPGIARRAAALLGVATPGGERALDAQTERWLAAAVGALKEAGERALVLAGDAAPAAVHALALAMNAALGSLGITSSWHRRVDRSALGEPLDLADLVHAMRDGEVSALVIVGSNPAHTAPADLAFADALRRLPGPSVHAGIYHDETGRGCDWHLPLAHELECWQDARSPAGRVSIVQPLIEPLYRGQAPQAVLELIATAAEASDRELVRAQWRDQEGFAGDDFEVRWRDSLLHGWIEGSEEPPVAAHVDLEAVRALVAASPEPASDALEIVFRPDATVWDGRYANNAWLQELPKPLTKLTWDNAALLSPALAHDLGVDTGDVVRLELDGRAVEAPVQVLPGQPDRSVCVSPGYGREAAGRVAQGCGFDAYRLRPSAQPWAASGLAIARTGARRQLAHTQLHHRMEGRHHLRFGTLAAFLADPAAVAAHEANSLAPAGPARGPAPPRPSLLAEWPYEGQQWGMVIDLGRCIGCGACTLACQAENNIPVVGRDEVRRGREMHWIRVDRYFEGPPSDPKFHFQPVPCMHCEKAPCELVCPVGATQHSHDGLNDMVYNRCVGTRYCSNNCPYKVRRFNFFAYAAEEPAPRPLQRNPEVTVRSRGVMEKCTYCVQRIRAAEVQARTESRRIRDGEVRTACQQVCPARAIAFGDLTDPASELAQWKAQPHGYAMLAELNTEPRTTYLAAITDPDPTLAALERERDRREPR